MPLEHYIKTLNPSYNERNTWFKNNFLLKSSLKIGHVIQFDNVNLQTRK